MGTEEQHQSCNEFQHGEASEVGRGASSLAPSQLHCRGRLFAALLVAAASIATPAAVAEPLALRLPPLDRAKLAREDLDADRKNLPGGFRFAVPIEVDLAPGRDGRWERLDAERSVWRLRVAAAGAKHLNFGFTSFHLPRGAALTIAAAGGKPLLGPYTAADNEVHGQLWTPILRGEAALIELVVPTRALDRVRLRLGRIGQGYRGFDPHDPLCKSGSCNMDVACLGSGDPWNENRRAVGAMAFGTSRFCTGSLLNNARNDRRMLFATASHCGINASNAASLVVYWNFDAPSCRSPGSTESGSNTVVGPTNQTQTGAIFLAATNDPFATPAPPATTASDVTLVELDDPPNPAHNVFWAGWDRGTAPATCSEPARCASIHHPSGDEKRITYSREGFSVGNIAAASGIHWRAAWDPLPPILPNLNPQVQPVPGVTEPGSSGSPLYNAQRRFVGVLSGGPSACGATGGSLSDLYGQLAHAWEGLGTASTRMRDYLDPDNSGATSIAGLDSANTGAIFANGFE
jgi:hypothetical protein